MTHRSVGPIGFLCLFALAGSVQASLLESYVTVLHGPHASPNETPIYGQARFAYSQHDRLLCYSVSLTHPAGSLLVRLLDDSSAELGQAFHPPAAGPGAAVGNCLGPLSPPQTASLRSHLLRLQIVAEDFPAGEAEGRIVRIEASRPAPIEQWRAISRLLELDGRQLALFRGLMRFGPAEWEELERRLGDEGDLENPPPPEPVIELPVSGKGIELPIPFDVLTLEQLRAELKEIFDLVAGLETAALLGELSTVKGINLRRTIAAGQGPAPKGSKGLQPAQAFQNLDLNQAMVQTDALAVRIRDAVATATEWFEDAQNSPFVQRLRDLEPRLLEEFDSAFDEFQLLKTSFFPEDFDTFAGPDRDCGPASSCGEFKTFLADRLSDLAAMAREVPGLVDVEVELAAEPALLTRLIDLTPPFALYLLKNVSDSALPEWREIAAEVTLLLEEVLADDEEAAGLMTLGAPRGADRACARVFRRERAVKALGFLLLFSEVIAAIVAEGYCETTFVFSGTVVVGGTVNPVAPPCRGIANFVQRVIGFVRRQLVAFRLRCDFEQQRATVIYEPNLRECRPLVGLFLPTESGGQLERIGTLLEVRLEQLADAGLATQKALTDAEGFLQLHRNELAAGRFRESFCCLCQAYEAVVPPESGSSAACDCP